MLVADSRGVAATPCSVHDPAKLRVPFGGFGGADYYLLGRQHVTEEEAEPVPPSPERVARRALTLAAVVCRSGIEGDAGNADAERFRKDVVRWIDDVGLTSEFEPNEMDLLKTPLGKLNDRQRIDASWRVEGLAVLGWALGRYELPPYDLPANGPDVAVALGFRKEKEDTVLSAPTLRDGDELRSLADQLFALHWRLRQYSLDGAPLDFVEVSRRAWFGPLPIDDLRICEGDLEVRGEPLSRAPEMIWREAMSIARERQQAANWLQGQDVLYSEVTCDT